MREKKGEINLCATSHRHIIRSEERATAHPLFDACIVNEALFKCAKALLQLGFKLAHSGIENKLPAKGVSLEAK